VNFVKFFGFCFSESDSIVEDDFGSSVVSLPTGHSITKRQIIFDEVGEFPVQESSRTPREADWPVNYDTDRKSNEYFVKVLVVADRSMIQYHQSNEDLKHYILILMSHAALLYKDASIGNSISLSVVNIWMLNNTVFTSNNSQSTGPVARPLGTDLVFCSNAAQVLRLAEEVRPGSQARHGVALHAVSATTVEENENRRLEGLLLFEPEERSQPLAVLRWWLSRAR
jgi:hypothetical protein